MQKFINKAGRLRSPKCISVPLRREVYDFLSSAAAKEMCSTVALIRGILEDVYDFYSGKPSEEVPGDD